MPDPIAKLSKIPDGGSVRVTVAGRELALYRKDSTIHAIDATCPHRGGPLDGCDLEDEYLITCPWHGWQFDIRTGRSPLQPAKVLCHKVTITGDDVHVELA